MIVPSKMRCKQCEEKVRNREKWEGFCEKCKKLNSDKKKKFKKEFEPACYQLIYKAWNELYEKCKTALSESGNPTTDLAVRMEVEKQLNDMCDIQETNLCSGKWLKGIWEKAVKEMSRKLADSWIP